MKDGNYSGAVWVAAAMLLVIAMLCAYVAAYFLRGHYSVDDPFLGSSREFASAWEASFFAPAAQLESAARGLHVEPTYPGYIYH